MKAGINKNAEGLTFQDTGGSLNISALEIRARMIVSKNVEELIFQEADVSLKIRKAFCFSCQKERPHLIKVGEIRDRENRRLSISICVKCLKQRFIWWDGE